MLMYGANRIQEAHCFLSAPSSYSSRTSIEPGQARVDWRQKKGRRAGEVVSRLQPRHFSFSSVLLHCIALQLCRTKYLDVDDIKNLASLREHAIGWRIDNSVGDLGAAGVLGIPSWTGYASTITNDG